MILYIIGLLGLALAGSFGVAMVRWRRSTLRFEDRWKDAEAKASRAEQNKGAFGSLDTRRRRNRRKPKR